MAQSPRAARQRCSGSRVVLRPAVPVRSNHGSMKSSAMKQRKNPICKGSSLSASTRITTFMTEKVTAAAVM
jgi:hypothetical protein